MAASPKLNESLNALRDDASKVLSDISKLTKNLSAGGGAKAEEVKENLMEGIEEKVQGLKERLETMNSELKQQAKKADHHVRDHPYSYILTALGVGALLGKFLFPRPRD